MSAVDQAAQVRAIDDPVTLARAARIVRVALARKRDREQADTTVDDPHQNRART